MKEPVQGPDGAHPIIQNCWVVADVESAIAKWLAIGVGTFFKFDAHFPTRYTGGDWNPCQHRRAGAVR